jgi:hypothetical protein
MLRTKEEIQLDILFKEREMRYLTSQIFIMEHKLEKLQVEYQRLEQELKELKLCTGL